jgi:hypothetical protein
MSEFTCLVCGGRNFRRGYYKIDVDVDIYSTAYNDVRVGSRSADGVHIDVNVDVDTSIHNETDERGDISMRLVSESADKYSRYDSHVNVYKYNCEECGFIMSFTKEKGVESKFEEKKRKEKENAYDWSNFGK